jgi:dissimilatory sulfite reductase (desulfoviridin) alpha/beta subunit
MMKSNDETIDTVVETIDTVVETIDTVVETIDTVVETIKITNVISRVGSEYLRNSST